MVPKALFLAVKCAVLAVRTYSRNKKGIQVHQHIMVSDLFMSFSEFT